MFAGNLGENEHGEFTDGVQSISIHTMIRQTTWEELPPDDPDFPGTEQALFQVLIVFYLQGGENTITINSNQIFFVKAEEIDQGDGTTRTRYFLAGQRDMSMGGKANEGRTWGHVKSLYLNTPE